MYIYIYILCVRVLYCVTGQCTVCLGGVLSGRVVYCVWVVYCMLRLCTVRYGCVMCFKAVFTC